MTMSTADRSAFVKPVGNRGGEIQDVPGSTLVTALHTCSTHLNGSRATSSQVARTTGPAQTLHHPLRQQRRQGASVAR